MKKTKSMVMGAAVLAALALPMVAGAAGKLVVQDNSTPAVDKFVVTDQGWIGSGLGTGVLPGSGLQISGQALQASQLPLRCCLQGSFPVSEAGSLPCVIPPHGAQQSALRSRRSPYPSTCSYV